MPRKRDEERAARAVALYSSGMTAREAGAEVGADNTTVIAWVGEATRRRGPRGRTDVASEVILRLHDEEHLSFAAIGETVGMSKTGARMRYYAAIGKPRPERAGSGDGVASVSRSASLRPGSPAGRGGS